MGHSPPFTELAAPRGRAGRAALTTAPHRLQAQSQPEEDDDAEEDEGEELGHTETYADYVPSKCECAAPAPGRPRPACTASVGSSHRQGQGWGVAGRCLGFWSGEGRPWAGRGGSSVLPTWHKTGDTTEDAMKSKPPPSSLSRVLWVCPPFLCPKQ